MEFFISTYLVEIGDEVLMEILLAVSALIASLSLLLIVIFVIITLKSAKQTMGEVSETLKRVETKLTGITEQSEQLMEKTNRIAEDAEYKLQTLNSLSSSAKNLGKSTDHMNKSILAISNEVATPPEKYRDFMERTTVITETAARIYYRFQRKSNKLNGGDLVMDWLGIGVLIIGTAFAMLCYFFIETNYQVIRSLFEESHNRQQTIFQKYWTYVTSQAINSTSSKQSTLGNVNEQVSEISPLFHIVGDAGKAAEKAHIQLLLIKQLL